MKKSELKQLIREVVKEITAEKPDYGTQLQMALKKAWKNKDVEEIAYYEDVMSKPTSASASFEQFKNSWAYEQWLKKPEIQKRIQDIQAEMKRFSYMKETMSMNPTSIGYQRYAGRLKQLANKAWIKGDAEAYAYYYDAFNKPVGYSDFDKFKRSPHYHDWSAKSKEKINNVKQEMERFGVIKENTNDENWLRTGDNKVWYTFKPSINNTTVKQFRYRVEYNGKPVRLRSVYTFNEDDAKYLIKYWNRNKHPNQKGIGYFYTLV